MKRYLSAISALAASALFFCSCDKKEQEPFVPFPEGSAKLHMMTESNGKTLLGYSDVYMTDDLNFNSERCPIFDMGIRQGIADIGLPDFLVMAPQCAVQLNHGYVICPDPNDCLKKFDSGKIAIAVNTLICKVFVDSWITENEKTTGANVYFLHVRPDDRMPAWNSTIGTLTWNFTTEKSDQLNLSLPSSDIECTVLNDEESNCLQSTVSGNTISFRQNGSRPTGGIDQRVRIRSGHAYTEVIIKTETAV